MTDIHTAKALHGVLQIISLLTRLNGVVEWLTLLLRIR
jgi:hypothetical protein